ncbi:MAG: phage baseplate assembly protein V [Quinella sp. 1Q5]|nr:phage baseplate assembly protein V [Quinella sp. 1Q5]
MPVLQGFGLRNKSYILPDVGESVVALMTPNSDDGFGFLLGSFYHDDSPPPAQSQDISMLKFADGTTISYDRASHELKIDCVGDIKIKGRRIYLNE